jgi:hypothetical protein
MDSYLEAKKMSKDLFDKITDANFEYENRNVRVFALKDHPEINLVGLKIGPFLEGEEYEVKFWVAEELEKKGIIRFREDESLDPIKLYKIHWKERVQPATQLSPLSNDFYPSLRRFISRMKKDSDGTSEKMKDYDRSISLAQDIVNCRLKKIVSLSSSSLQTDQILRNLSKEERILYNNLYETINGWRSIILKEK